MSDALLQADCRLRLLCAPAGSGKSVLLGECVRQCPPDTRLIHIDLRGQPTSPEALIERLAAALGLSASSIDELEDHLANLSGPTWLVLDDYPRSLDVELDRTVNRLVVESPFPLRWWIASRRRPHLQLARLLLEGELFELGSRELAFREDELGELLKRSGHEWPRASQLNLLEQTHGWCAGLCLRLHGIRASQPLQDHNQLLLLDYLKREVLADLSDELRHALFTFAHLPSIEPALCEHLFGSGDGARWLEQLNECGLFIEPIDQEGRCFRIQPALAPILADQLPANMAKALYRKACQWYLSQEQIGPALDFALKADQPDVAASLMQRYTEDRLLQGRELALLLEWRRELPESLLSGTPRLALLNAWALTLSGRLEEAQQFVDALDRFTPQPSAEQQHAFIAQWKALTGKLAFHRGAAEQARTLVAEAVAELPESDWSQRLLCELLQVEQALIDGEFEHAQALNRAAIKRAREYGSLALESLMTLEHAKQLEIRGELLRAETLLSRLYTELTPAWDTPSSPMRGRAQLLRAGLLLQSGRYAEAESAFQAGVQECQSCADPAAVWGHLGLAELDALHGDTAGAFHRIADAERLMQYSRISVPLYQGLLVLTRARLWLSQGRHANAAKALREQLAQATQLPPFGAPELNVRLRLLLVQAQLAAGEASEAMKELQAMLAKAAAEGRRVLACEIGFSLAEAMYACNRQTPARKTLLEAISQARQMGLVSVERSFAQRNPALMRWVGTPGGSDSQAPALLSRRELDVLQLIVQGMSNQQIAEALFISLHTVKTHAQRINTKLGVERRTQLVVRAKELGLSN